MVVGDFAHHPHARAERQHLRAFVRHASPPIADLAAVLGALRAGRPRMLKRIVDGEHHHLAALDRLRLGRADERMGERQRQQQINSACAARTAADTAAGGA